MIINIVVLRLPTTQTTTKENKRRWKYFKIIFNIFQKNVQHSKYKTPDDDDDDDDNIEANTQL
jgi:hypothetical protein